ncbi:MAG: hypothetical protein KDB03_06325 [Planctomycetales bacterium]|nr:hypothetical protein [Planctomycetales bacterium]
MASYRQTQCESRRKAPFSSSTICQLARHKVSESIHKCERRHQIIAAACSRGKLPYAGNSQQTGKDTATLGAAAT